MRFRIQFQLSGKNQKLPLNYQYPISAWVYKVLSKADTDFTNMLHNHGYQLENGKTFKLFTFSKLNFPKHTWKIIPKSDRMNIWARKAWITVSFQLPEQSEKFIMGLFKEQKAFFGDKISGIYLEVESVEALKDVEIGRLGDVEIGKCLNVKMRTVTAIVLGVDIEGDDNEQYVSPLHPEYKVLFLKNLLDKYEATGKKGVSIEDLDFVVGKISAKTTMQTIKAFTPAETKVRGYNYEFELTASKEVLEVGLNSGFGSMCSLGFGFCEVVKQDLRN